MEIKPEKKDDTIKTEPTSESRIDFSTPTHTDIIDIITDII